MYRTLLIEQWLLRTSHHHGFFRNRCLEESLSLLLYTSSSPCPFLVLPYLILTHPATPNPPLPSWTSICYIMTPPCEYPRDRLSPSQPKRNSDGRVRSVWHWSSAATHTPCAIMHLSSRHLTLPHALGLGDQGTKIWARAIETQRQAANR